MKTTNKRNAIIYSFLIVLSMIVTITGFELLINFHPLRLYKNSIVWGFSYYNWVMVHEISAALFVMFAIIHLYLHFGWYKSFLKCNVVNNKLTLMVTVLFILTLLTSFIPFIIKTLFRIKGGFPEFIRFFYKAHNKIGIIFAVLLIIHILSRKDKIVKMFTKLLH